MPGYAVARLAELAGDLAGARVLILGVTYRGAVKETAFSGAFAVRDALLGLGATAVAADPLYDAAEIAALGFEPGTASRSPPRSCRPTIPSTQRSARTTSPVRAAILDGRGILDPAPFTAAGVAVRRLGRPDA